MRITFISDTHATHGYLTDHLIGGDVIIHSGDLSSVGKLHEIEYFLDWYNKLPYTNKVFIAGNHDWGFQRKSDDIKIMLEFYPDIIYLQDEEVIINGVKIYGSPWQPEFYNWAFNLPRNGKELEFVWSKIPDDTDILITHGPSFGNLDNILGHTEKLGCEQLKDRVDVVKPKIHAFGHIHSGYGYKFSNDTHFINASNLDEEYHYTQEPLTVDWDPITNEIGFVEEE